MEGRAWYTMGWGAWYTMGGEAWYTMGGGAYMAYVGHVMHIYMYVALLIMKCMYM